MEETVSNDILEWLRALRKSYDMSVLDFVNRLDELNNLINYCPDINNVNPKPLEDMEKMGILRKACPKDWTDTITKSNLKFTTYRSL
eukprot:8511989-Ditylum_brightwellii.AAC.1